MIRIRSVLFTLIVAAILAGSALAQPTAYTRVGAWPFGPSQCIEIDPSRDLAFLGSGDDTYTGGNLTDVAQGGAGDDTLAGSPDQYVEIAARLGLDEGWRSAVTEKTRAQSAAIYDDETPIRDLEAFLSRVTGGAAGDDTR